MHFHKLGDPQASFLEQFLYSFLNFRQTGKLETQFHLVSFHVCDALRRVDSPLAAIAKTCFLNMFLIESQPRAESVCEDRLTKLFTQASK